MRRGRGINGKEEQEGACQKWDPVKNRDVGEKDSKGVEH